MVGMDAWAESYKIVFQNNTSSSTAISSSTKNETVINGGKNYVMYQPFTVNSGKSYYGDTKNCIRVGFKYVSDASLSIALSDEGKVYATSIVVNAMNCGGNCSSATLAVNGKEALTTTSEAATDYTYQINENIEAITLATSAGVYIYSITVNYTKNPYFTVNTVDTDFYSLFLDHAVKVPENANVYKGSLDGNSLKLTKIESIIPANTGVVFTAKTAGDVTFQASDDEDPFKDNDIKGVAKETPISDIETNGGKILVLGWVDGKVGFAQPEIGATTLAANKAYIIVPSTASSKVSMLIDDAMAVEYANVVKTESNVYNLSGQRVNKDAKGIVVVNGKQIIRK